MKKQLLDFIISKDLGNYNINYRLIPANDLGETHEYEIENEHMIMTLSHHSKGYLEVVVFDKDINTTIINQIVENDCYGSVDYLLRNVKNIWKVQNKHLSLSSINN